MRIDYQDYGTAANVVITSTVFEFRKHNRVVDTVLFLEPGVISQSWGFFLMKTVISGKTRHALRAYKTAQREAERLKYTLSAKLFIAALVAAFLCSLAALVSVV